MTLTPKSRWVLGGLLAISVVALAALAMAWDGPTCQFLVRLYKDKAFLRQTLQEWGMLAPVIFVVIQALQVVMSPVPGEATGFLGGYLFGLWQGFIYSSIGLTLGSVCAFAVGRWLGVRFVRDLVNKETWNRLGFIVEAEGAILCFIIYLIPGFPKDMVCYLFGISPMPTWVFALVSGLGRLPGTWVLSAQGSRTATGQYWQVILLTAVVAAIALPLYYYRHQIVGWFCRWTPRAGGSRGLPERLDTEKRRS
jgi:uncharacterized membrane protein YdjX (TVP38/TMEM64 family)